MDTFLVNNYGTSSSGTASSSPTSTSSASNAALDTTSFLKLLAKELSCQDPLNPTQDSDFIAQMAQMTSLENSENMYSNSTQELEEMQSLMQLSTMQYGAALVGKTVHVTTQDSNGNNVEHQGVVSNVNYSDDACTLTIDGNEYPIASVTQVA